MERWGGGVTWKGFEPTAQETVCFDAELRTDAAVHMWLSTSPHVVVLPTTVSPSSKLLPRQFDMKKRIGSGSVQGAGVVNTSQQRSTAV